MIASNAGNARVPRWFLNLTAADDAVVYVGRRSERVKPRVVEGPEREQVLHDYKKVYPAVDDYAAFTDRRFPVVVLEPVDRREGGQPS